MASPKVICWNSSGLRASAKSTPVKIAFFDKEFPKGNFAIAAFVETHHKNEDDFPDEIKEYLVTHHLLHTPTPPGQTQSGIIVLINKEYEIKDNKDIIPGRLMNIKIVHVSTRKDHNLSFFYGPRWSNMNKMEITFFGRKNIILAQNCTKTLRLF